MTVVKMTHLLDGESIKHRDKISKAGTTWSKQMLVNTIFNPLNMVFQRHGSAYS